MRATSMLALNGSAIEVARRAARESRPDGISNPLTLRGCGETARWPPLPRVRVMVLLLAVHLEEHVRIEGRRSGAVEVCDLVHAQCVAVRRRKPRVEGEGVRLV